MATTNADLGVAQPLKGGGRVQGRPDLASPKRKPKGGKK